MSKKITQEEFETRLKEINPNIKVLGEYTKNAGHIECECSVCGHKWSPVAKSLLRGSGCPKCAGNLKITQEEFETRIKEINPNIKILGKYTRSNDHIGCKCLVCGHEWSPVANNLYYAGCPKCARKLTQEEFEIRLKKINPNIKVLGKYIKRLNHIECECLVCGHKWNPVANNLLTGSGCPICANKIISKKNILSHEDFIKIVEDENPYFKNIEFLEKYKGQNNGTKIKCRCKICGHIWSVRPDKLAHFHSGCPECVKTYKSSYAENFIFYSLYYVLKDKTDVVQNDMQAVGKELDIYLPEYKFAIEVGSWYFHKKSFDNDLAKAKLCLDNNINLIVIYEKFNENIKLPDNFYVYPINLAYEKNHKMLKEIVYMILNKLNIEYIYSEEDWKHIKQNLYYESNRLKLERFKELFKEKNPNSDTIEILNEHYTANKIQCRCKVCGREWTTIRSSLLEGHGCKDCGRKEAGLKNRKNAS